MTLLSFLPPLLLGFLLTSFLWPEPSLRSGFLLKSCLAVGVGMGASSCVFFLWSVVVRPSRGFVVAEVTLFSILAAILFRAIRNRRNAMQVEAIPEAAPRSKAERLLVMAMPPALASAASAFLLVSLSSPHGGWDAWAIWNMRARFIFRGGEHWTDAFSSLSVGGHPDYPVFIPGFVARCWVYVGHETLAVPAAVAMLFAFATVGLLFSSLSLLRGTSQGCLAGLVLLGTPFFVQEGAYQQADVPLAFFFLATTVLLCLQDSSPSNGRGLTCLAGVTAGFSAWTKNEGLLFLACLIASRLILAREWKASFRRASAFAVGLGPILLTILYFKTQLAPPSDLVFSQSLNASVTRLADVSRYWQVAKAFETEAVGFGGWVLSIPLLLVAYLLVVGTQYDERDEAGIATALVTFSLLMMGYCLVYIMSPYDLGWHLTTSLPRLLLQLWPSLLFTFFLIARASEQAPLGGRAQKSVGARSSVGGA